MKYSWSWSVEDFFGYNIHIHEEYFCLRTWSLSMSNKRLSQLEKNLESQYKILGAAEDGINQAQSTVAVAKYELEIDTSILPKIRKYEEEYFRILADYSQDIVFEEADAQIVLALIAEELVRLKEKSDLSDVVLEKLARIEEKIDAPGVTADAKLKATLSVFPPFLGLCYEGQVDTENFCRKYLPTFTNLVKKAQKKIFDLG
jgi:hypothetical protein